MAGENETDLRAAADAGDVDARLRLAFALEDRGAVDEAINEFRRVSEAGHLNGTGNLGRLLKARGDYEAAESAFKLCADAGSERAYAEFVALKILRGGAYVQEVERLVALWARHMDTLPPDASHAPDDLSNEQMDAFVFFDSIRELWREDPGNFSIVDTVCPPELLQPGLRAASETSPAAARDLGRLHLMRRELAKAALAFEQAATSGWPSCYLQATIAHVQNDDLVSGRRLAQLTIDNDVFGGHWVMGLIQSGLKDHRAASHHYLKADAAGDARGSLQLGKTLLGVAEMAESGGEMAVPYLEKAVEAGIDGAVDLLARAHAVG